MEKQLKGKDLVYYLMERFNYTKEKALQVVEEKNLISLKELKELKESLPK